MQSQTPGPAAKRRRVDQANATLRKPFRSPLITRPKPEDSSSEIPTPGPAQQSSSSTPLLRTPARTSVVKGAQQSNHVAFTPLVGRGRGTPGPSAAGFSTTSPVRNANYNSPLMFQQTPSRLPSKSITRANSARSTTAGRGQAKPLALAKGNAGSVASHGVSDGDDLLAQLRKSQRETAAQIRELRQELDVVRQARRIEDAAKRRQTGNGKGEVDAELKELILKWKFASRQAAEDLFELIKERVAGMGGARAWRETRKQQHEFFQSGFDDHDGGTSSKHKKRGKRGHDGHDYEDEGGEVSDSDHNEDEYEDASPSHLENDNGDQETQNEEGEEEGSNFTMLMMLRSLNIDPDILGYDATEDKWQDT